MSNLMTHEALDKAIAQAENYRLRVHRKARAHYLAAKNENRMHQWLGIPVVVTTTIVGTAIFATLSKDPDIYLKILTGLLSVLAGVLASLQTFFKHAELSEKHKTAAASYATMVRAFDLFKLRLSQNPSNADDGIKQLGDLVQKLDRLERDSPDISDHFYDQAVREQREDKEGV